MSGHRIGTVRKEEWTPALRALYVVAVLFAAADIVYAVHIILSALGGAA